MIEIEIYENGAKASIPERWSEMSPEQIRRVFRLNDRCIRKGRPAGEFRIRFLYALLGLKLGRRTARIFLSRDRDTLAENVARLCEACLGKFFLEDAEGVLRLSFDDIRNPQPVIRRGIFRRPLIGPSDLLQDLTFGEFRHASNAVSAFFRDGNLQDLNECIGFLYRPAAHHRNRAGRAVAPILPEKDVARIAKLPDWRKNLAMMWLSACLHTLQTGTIVVDGDRIDLSQLFSSEGEAGSSGADSSGWSDLLLQIAKDGVIGNIDRVDEEPLFSILRIMWSNYKEAKRYEKVTKSH